ncbi:MAG: hypothetical protein KJZ65_14010 [Phycisphaerales bacterium]|nr:hypothetical protein [Phycisphaerales bacterium]
MTIDHAEAVERDDLAPHHPLTPARRLRIIAEILAEGVRRRREDARRMGDSGDISLPPEREESGLELLGPARLDRPLQGG